MNAIYNYKTYQYDIFIERAIFSIYIFGNRASYFSDILLLKSTQFLVLLIVEPIATKELSFFYFYFSAKVLPIAIYSYFNRATFHLEFK